MEGEGRWSSEALQAMDTHLCLLQKSNLCETNGAAAAAAHCPPAKPVRLPRQCDKDMGPHLDLNSHLPLPHGWEQFLDLQTGQVYYIDWKRCRRSYTDPRILHSEHNCIDDSDMSECTSDADNCHMSNMHDMMQVNTKLVTSPMLQEDWNLMEVRGWMSVESDEHSEITSEVTSPNHVCDGLIHNSPKLGSNEKSLSI